jgi:hypothetical protein
MLTFVDSWNAFWGPIINNLQDSEVMTAIGGVIGTIGVPTLILIYYKFIAPKLAKMKFMNKQFDEFLKIAERMDEKMESTLGFDLKLKEDLILLRELFGLAFKNSNLDNHTKALIDNVLTGIVNGEKIDLSEDLEGISEGAKKFIADSETAVKQVVEENKNSALAQLNAEVAKLKEETQTEELNTEQEG